MTVSNDAATSMNDNRITSPSNEWGSGWSIEDGGGGPATLDGDYKWDVAFYLQELLWEYKNMEDADIAHRCSFYKTDALVPAADGNLVETNLRALCNLLDDSKN